MVPFFDVFVRACGHIESSLVDRSFVLEQWPNLRASYRMDLEAISDTAAFEEFMKRLVGDEIPLSHTSFLTPDQVEYIRAQSRGERIPDFLHPIHETYGRISYIKLSSFSLTVFSMKVLAEFFDAGIRSEFLVLDLRLNAGGSACAAGDLLGCLLGPEVPYMLSRLPDWELDLEPENVYPVPAEQNQDHRAEVELIASKRHLMWSTPVESPFMESRPVCLLTDSMTYSTGELFAATLKNEGRGVVVGQRTAGMLLGARDDYDCGYGYYLLLPFVELLTSRASPIEGEGVTPDFEYDFSVESKEPLLREELEQIVQLAGLT